MHEVTQLVNGRAWTQSSDYKVLANHKQTVQNNLIARRKVKTEEATFPKFISLTPFPLPTPYFRIPAKLVPRGLLKNRLGSPFKWVFLGPTHEILNHWAKGVSDADFLKPYPYFLLIHSFNKDSSFYYAPNPITSSQISPVPLILLHSTLQIL